MADVTPRTRDLSPDDAPALARLVRADRAFLAPWDADRGEQWFTDDGQREDVATALRRRADGLAWPCVVLDDDREVVGRINLNNIVRGAFQSCSVGYWVTSAANGRGYATGAVAELLRTAFEDLGLHRVEAGTLLHNAASQRVLEKNGFTRFGLAPKYLKIAGRWQDHVLFQVLDPRSP